MTKTVHVTSPWRNLLNKPKPIKQCQTHKTPQHPLNNPVPICSHQYSFESARVQRRWTLQDLPGRRHRLRPIGLWSHGHVYYMRTTLERVSNLPSIHRQSCAYLQSIVRVLVRPLWLDGTRQSFSRNFLYSIQHCTIDMRVYMLTYWAICCIPRLVIVDEANTYC